MKTTLTPLLTLAGLALLLTATPRLPADDAEEAGKLVAKAIKATGLKPDSPETAQSWTDTGKMTLFGQEMNYVAKWVFQPPNKYRFDMEMKFNGQDMKVLVINGGDKGWESAQGQTQEIKGKKWEAVKHETYQMWVGSLLPLRDSAFKLSLLPDKEIDGKPCPGVKVSRQDHPDVKIYFDREAGLVVMTESKVLDEFQNWKEVTDEAYFSDYKDVGGLKVFCKMKLLRDGKPLIETVFSDQKRMEQADPKLFEKP